MNRLAFRWFGWLLCFVITVVLCERSYAIVRAEPLGPIEWMKIGATSNAPSESAEMSLSSPETSNPAPNRSYGATPPASAQTSLPRVQFLPLLTNFSSSGTANPAPNCRYGATADAALRNWLAPLGAGWSLDFSARAPKPLPGVEFVPVLRVHQKKNGCTYLNDYSVTPPLTDSGLGALIASQPGALWLVGNEPDRGPNPENCADRNQDDTYPEIYAQAYHDTYQFIKSRDATARVAIAGLVEATPGRLQYLEKVWQTYQQRYQTTIPVDVWNMHLYILPEAGPDGTPNGVANVALGTDPALAIRESGDKKERCADPGVYCWAEHDDLTAFAQQVVAMRTWMQQHGERDKPLIVSEYGQLYPFTGYDDPVNPTRCFLMDEYGKCFTQARITSFLNRTFAYLESATDANLGYPLDGNRLVQQWMWYSVYTQGLGYDSNLVTSDLRAFTQPGMAFRNAVASVPTYVNLVPRNAVGTAGRMPIPARPITATLYVDIINSGNVQSPAPFTVTAYEDQALTRPIGSVKVTLGINGCFQRTTRVSITWPDLSVGPHSFWFKVDSTDAVSESAENDNVIMGKVTVYPYGVLLPWVMGR